MKNIVIMLASLILGSLTAVPVLAEEPAAAVAPKAAPAAAESVKSAPAPVSASAPATPAKTDKAIRIGVVDMAAIAKDSAPGKAAYAEVKSKTEKYQKQIQAKQKQLQKLRADIEAKMPTLAPELRDAEAKKFQKKFEEFQKFAQKAEKDVRAKEEELLGKLFKSVEKAAGEYAMANGFTAVVMKNQLLYVEAGVETKDLTEQMIKLVGGTPVNK
jgi:outer membrane protein